MTVAYDTSLRTAGKDADVRLSMSPNALEVRDPVVGIDTGVWLNLNMPKDKMKRGLVALSLCFLLFGVGAQKLYAHTSLMSSSPEREERVSDLQEIELTFSSGLIDDGNAKITLSTIREGKEIPIGETTFVSEFIIRADVSMDLEPGQYVVRYHVTALDGDLNDGGYAFELLPSKGNDVIWILLGAGLVAIASVMFLLRKKPERDKR